MQPLMKTAANVFREICCNYRDFLMAGILVAGWDKQKDGQVYSIPISGMCVSDNQFQLVVLAQYMAM